MTHLDERSIMELRDGFPVDAAVHAHLATCPTCKKALESAVARVGVIDASLGSLDEPIDLARAKAAVRARVQTPRPAVRRVWGGALGRAAALVLVSAGAAYAIPGSPVREWLRPTPAAVEVPTPPTATAGAEETVRPGVRLRAGSTPVDVALSGALGGSTIEIVPSLDGAVSVSAAPGSTFSSGTGIVRAVVAAGLVTIEAVPEAIGIVTLDGQVVVERRDGRWVLGDGARLDGENRVVIEPGG